MVTEPETVTGAIGSLLAGLVIGVFFFGGLWWTVRRMPESQHPAVLFLFSFLVRTAVTVVGFRFVMQDDWQQAAWCMLGFLAARTIFRRRLRPVRWPVSGAASVTASAADSPVPGHSAKQVN